METEFTPWASLIGGCLIGLAAAFYWVGLGRIAGISGIVSKLLPPIPDGETPVRVAFILGLIAAPFVYMVWTGKAFPIFIEANYAALAIAGLLVGAGTVLGSGCTSGHGVCGVARLSKRSIAATSVFMGAAIVTAALVRHVFGG